MEHQARVIPLRTRQSEGVSEPAELFARQLRETLAELLQAEALRQHEGWLAGMLSAPRGGEQSFEQAIASFSQRLREELEANPLEDGVTHTGEVLLDRMLRSHSAPARAWLEAAMRDRQNALRGDLMRLVGRLPRARAVPWGYDLAAISLADPDLDVRDAAVKALEQWRGPSALNLLRTHTEAEPWLSDYLARLVEELKREG